MVLENIIHPEWVEKNPLYALVLGGGLSSIGIWIGVLIFPQDASIAGILFTLIAALPFLRKILKLEEAIEERARTLKGLFFRNKTIIEVYFMFFIGMVIAYTFWYVICPDNITAMIFSRQLEMFIAPQSVSLLGGADVGNAFMQILANNIKVIFIILILSLLYGAGAVLIITWNASVLGVFLGSFGRVMDAVLFLPHVCLEFSGFFIAAVAGGMIATALDKQKINMVKFDRILLDFLILFGISIAFIVAGAYVEALLIA